MKLAMQMTLITKKWLKWPKWPKWPKSLRRSMGLALWEIAPLCASQDHRLIVQRNL